MFQTNVVENIKNVKKKEHCGTGQAPDGNTTGRMHIAAEYLRLQIHT
jgi:hypothetical protein